MTVVERRIGEITILDLEGRLVFEEGDSVLRSHVDHLVSEGRRNIIVNLRDVVSHPAFAKGGDVSAETLIKAGLIRDTSRALKILGSVGEEGLRCAEDRGEADAQPAVG